MKLKLCHSASLRYVLAWYPLLPKSKLSDSGRKPWTIVRRSDKNSFRAHNSSQEGDTELKFAPFYSS